MFSHLKRSTKRLLLLLALLPSAVVLMGSVYMLGMATLEGQPRTLLESLQWAAETLTTTGYGHDSHWRHPLMALYVILGQFLGQFLVFLIFPIFVLPYVEERFEVRLQRALPEMSGKVLFYRHGLALESLLDEFRRKGSPCVILEEDIATARNLRDRGHDVVLGRVDDDPRLLARVQQARAVVANASDHANAAFAMAVREAGFTGPLFALAAEPLYRAPMLQIGATEVFTPSHALGAALASRASQSISPPAEGLHLLGNSLAMAEFRVAAESQLAGRRLGELQLRDRHGVSVIGQWRGGEFSVADGPNMQVEPGAILVVVGAQARLEAVERMAMLIRRSGPIVVAGFGAVGQKVVELLRDAGETCVVIDVAAGPGVDVVGNVLDSAVLERAGTRQASALVLALSSDAESVFATAAVREYAPGVPLIVRALHTHNISRIYRTGADFAISVGQVAGQILAHHLLAEQGTAVETTIRVGRLGPGSLVGQHPWRNGAVERSGAKLVAVERGSEVIVDFDAGFTLRADDVVFVCGTAASLAQYQREFDATPPVGGL